jgi:hypothetical protein
VEKIAQLLFMLYLIKERLLESMVGNFVALCGIPADPEAVPLYNYKYSTLRVF